MVQELWRWRSRAWKSYLMRSPFDFKTASAKMWSVSVELSRELAQHRVGGSESAQVAGVPDAKELAAALAVANGAVSE